MTTFEERIREIANEEPNLNLSWAVQRVDYELNGAPFPTPGPQSDAATLAGFALDSALVMQHLPDKKINAIKELRQLTGAGLKESKDAVELAVEWKRKGWISSMEKERIERDSERAIESIKGTIAAIHAGAKSAGVELR